MTALRTTGVAFERGYTAALRRCLRAGRDDDDRTGTGVRRLQHVHLSWEGIALLRGKRQYPTSILAEALWILRGLTDTSSLNELGCHYWDRWGLELGRTYGAQLRDFNGEKGPGDGCRYGIDQLAEVCRMIREEPASRRIVMTLWHPGDLDACVLPPCHLSYQFCVTDGVVDMHVTQRSGDAFVGVPADCTLVSLVLALICMYCGVRPGRIHYTVNDFHIYRNHIGAVCEYLDRDYAAQYGGPRAIRVRGKGVEYDSPDAFLTHPPQFDFSVYNSLNPILVPIAT